MFSTRQTPYCRLNPMASKPYMLPWNIPTMINDGILSAITPASYPYCLWLIHKDRLSRKTSRENYLPVSFLTACFYYPRLLHNANFYPYFITFCCPWLSHTDRLSGKTLPGNYPHILPDSLLTILDSSLYFMSSLSPPSVL